MLDPTLVILNGVSGSGKTTTAQRLQDRLGASWIHPDGIWDTPNLTPERILELALSKINEASTTIIDCQIRPSSIVHILATSRPWVSVLHTCPRAIREKRLMERGWQRNDFETIENWSNLLLAEHSIGDYLIVNSSTQSTTDICEMIAAHLSKER